MKPRHGKQTQLIRKSVLKAPVALQQQLSSTSSIPAASLLAASIKALQSQQLAEKRSDFLQSSFPDFYLLFPRLWKETTNQLHKALLPSFLSSTQSEKNSEYMFGVVKLIIAKKNIQNEDEFTTELQNILGDLTLTSNPYKLSILYRFYQSFIELLTPLVMTPSQSQSQVISTSTTRNCESIQQDLMTFIKNNCINYDPDRVGMFDLQHSSTDTIRTTVYGIRCKFSPLVDLTTRTSVGNTPLDNILYSDTMGRNIYARNSEFNIYVYTSTQKKQFEKLVKEYGQNCSKYPKFIKQAGNNHNIILVLDR
jgi:hypothetical protein